MLSALLLFLVHVINVQAGQVQDRVEAAQRSGTRFVPVNLFERLPSAPATDALWQKEVKEADVLRLDEQQTRQLMQAGAAAITLTLPSASGPLVLDLLRAEVSRDELVVRVASTGRTVTPDAAVHYRGVVRGSAGHIAAVSIFEGEVMALVSDDQGSWV
ncbi:MAG: hypothetical protein MUE88_07435, partial [Flavobacteriales bacterium]|nr:hypothetical protein [Flavobacteriales bacterium]